jgi:glyceraldehyde 3-phosphate dehydrogenase
LVPGLNLDTYDPASHHLVSCSTCTANALAPVLQVIDQAFGVQWAGVGSVHPALSGDTLLDSPATEFETGRGSLQMRATSSGLALSTTRLLPHLAGHISGMTFRVPTATVNCLLAHVVLERPPSDAQEIRQALADAATGRLKNIIRIEDGWQGRPLAAGDFRGDPHSAVVDGHWLELTGPLLRLVIWHDNEYAYCCRVADVIQMVAGRLAQAQE